MSTRLRVAPLLVLGAVCLALPAAAQSTADAVALLNDVRYLSDDRLGGRLIGASGADSAADYLARRFRQAGLRPSPSGWFQPFTVAADAPAAAHTGIGGAVGKNVIGVLPGRDPALRNEIVVVGAHYDHLGPGNFGALDPDSAGRIHNGADDNASGTAAVLAAAEALISQADARWQPQLEVRVGTHGEAIDLVLFGTDEIQAHEIERSLGNFQAQLRRADQKRAALAAQHHRPVRLVLVIEDTKRNRDAVAAHEAAIRTALPGGSRDVLRSVRPGDPLGRAAILWIRQRRFRRGPPRG